jgi:hypothetical protein
MYCTAVIDDGQIASFNNVIENKLERSEHRTGLSQAAPLHDL